MSHGFWKKLKRPVLALAPMANVTDAAFRRIIAKHGKPDVMWTEFVSADGLCSAGRKNLLAALKFTQRQRPIVAQIFGSKPENIAAAARLIKQLGFDGVDINMGCPDRAVVKQGAGAALIQNPALAKKIIAAAKRGAHPLPVSVKTRSGYDRDTLARWLPHLLQARPAAIIIHARTKKEMSAAPARWDAVARAVKIRDRLKSKTLIIGNGDVASVAEAKIRAAETGCDGVMLGRAVFGNPWLFAEKTANQKEKLKVLLEHTKLFEKLLGRHQRFDIMKKHFKAYVTGYPNAKKLRARLMRTKTAAEVAKIIRKTAV